MSLLMTSQQEHSLSVLQTPFNLILAVRCRSILGIQFFTSASLPAGILKYLESFSSGADLGEM